MNLLNDKSFVEGVCLSQGREEFESLYYFTTPIFYRIKQHKQKIISSRAHKLSLVLQLLVLYRHVIHTSSAHVTIECSFVCYHTLFGKDSGSNTSFSWLSSS
jgi:hypothetical protein